MFQNNKGKVVVVPNTVSKEKLAIEVVKLQETVKNLTEKDSNKQVGEVVHEIKHVLDSTYVSTSPENISLPSQLYRFLNMLLHNDADMPLTTKVSSFARDLLYTLN